jgi:hypothetical protein
LDIRNLKAHATVLLLMAAAAGSHAQDTSPSALQLTPRPVLLRADDNSRTTRTVYTTDGPAFLKASVPVLPEPNKSIVELMLEYPTDGTHDYWWPKSGGGGFGGATKDIVLNGKTVLKGEPEKRTFCCGLTLEVFYRYLEDKPAVAAKVAADADKFKGDWFCRELNSPGPLDALLGAGIGKKVELDEALPGDFVQLWRNGKSGHSVIFVNWIKDATGKRVGLQYWSTQTSTNGIGFASESFGPAANQINPQHFSVVRPTI